MVSGSEGVHWIRHKVGKVGKKHKIWRDLQGFTGLSLQGSNLPCLPCLPLPTLAHLVYLAHLAHLAHLALSCLSGYVGRDKGLRRLMGRLYGGFMGA